MKKEGILAVIGFALGLLFYAKLLDKPERQFIIKRLKMKKGAGNTMDVSMIESQAEASLDFINAKMSRGEVRKAAINKWKELKELQTNKK